MRSGRLARSPNTSSLRELWRHNPMPLGSLAALCQGAAQVAETVGGLRLLVGGARERIRLCPAPRTTSLKRHLGGEASRCEGQHGAR